MTTEIIIILLIAIVVCVIIGGLIVYSSQKRKVLNLDQQLKMQADEVEQLTGTNLEITNARNDLQAELLRAEGLREQSQRLLSQTELQLQERSFQLNKANEEKAILYEKLKSTREKLNNQQNDTLRLRERFRLDFSELAKRILDDNSKKVSESNEQSTAQFLELLRNNINEFRRKVQETYNKQSKESLAAVKEVVGSMAMSQPVSHEANNVTIALKGYDKLPGGWGEMILKSLLAGSSLTDGREYFLQELIRDNARNILKDENGKELQPDVIISYPDKTKIIIDVKVSLSAWEQYINCSDQDQQRLLLQDHIRSLRLHIDTLSKIYPKDALSLAYILLFIPSEPALLEACKTDLQLREYAYEKGILLVSPTNLYAVLKIVAEQWKVEQRYRNAIEIVEKADAVYDRFTGFIDNIESVSKQLEDVTNCYTEAFKQLSSGRGNIIARIEELKKIANNQLPGKLTINVSEDETLN